MIESILLVAAFLAPGAWMVFTLPAPPIAQLSFCIVVALWLGCFGFGILPFRKIDKKVLIGIGAVLVSVALSTLLNPYIFQTLFYDIYGDNGGMPVVIWVCFILFFVLAAMVSLSKDSIRGLRIVFGIGVALAIIAAVWRWTQGFVTIFGSPAFAGPALTPLVILGLALGYLEKKHAWVYYVASAVFAICLLFAMGGLLAAAALVFGLILALALCPRLYRIPAAHTKIPRIVGSVLLAAALIATLIAEVPSLSGAFVSTDKAATMEQTVATRLLLWDGAEKMFEQKPVFGYGPSGYRINAMKYYDSKLFPFVSSLGSDPTAYSAPSPHSLLWDILLRLGVVGLLAHLALLVVWIGVIRRRLKTDTDASRALRLGLATAFGTYLFSLMFTPVNFASGAIGAVLAGLAIAPIDNKHLKETVVTQHVNVYKAICVILAIGFLVFGIWRAVGLSAENKVSSNNTPEQNLALAKAAAKIMPGEPLNERHILEMQIATSQNDAELKRAQKAAQNAPGYIVDYSPNLAQFVMISLNDANVTGREDLAWENQMLKRASEGYPSYPLLEEVQKQYDKQAGGGAN